jgi:hypothetical protein
VAVKSDRGIASRREDGLAVGEKMLGRRRGEGGDARAAAWGGDVGALGFPPNESKIRACVNTGR